MKLFEVLEGTVFDELFLLLVLTAYHFRPWKEFSQPTERRKKDKYTEFYVSQVQIILSDNCTAVQKTPVLLSQLSFIVNIYAGYMSCHLSTPPWGLWGMASRLLSYSLLIKMLDLRESRNSIPVASELSPRANPRFHSRKSYELPLLLDAICTAAFLTIVGAKPRLQYRTNSVKK